LRIRLALVGLSLLTAGCAHFAPQPPPSPAEREAQGYATYLSARFAAEDHDMSEAAKFYRRSLAGDPANPELLSLSFFYSTTAGDFGAAANLARRVVGNIPDDRASRLLLAADALKHNDYAQTRKQLALSAKSPFTTLTVSLIDAWAAAGAGDDAAAEADVKQLEAESGAEAMAAFHRALLAEYENKPVEAEAAYHKAMSGGAVGPRLVEAYGRFMERSGRTAEASTLYSRFTGNGGLAPVALAGLARIKAGAKPPPLVSTPQEGAAEALFGIAASLTDASNADVSILYLRLSLYLRPDLALGDILLADRMESLHKYDEAISIYRLIDKSSPYYRMAAVQAAIDETRNENLDGAIADLKVLTASDPNDVESWTALGDAWREAQKFDAAIDAYDHAIATLSKPTPKDWALYYARATAQESLNHWDAAEADLDEALRLSPDQPEVMNFLGYSWVDQGRRIPEALAMLEKARSLRPFDGYIVDSVGWAYYRLGRYDDAAKTLEDAVLLVPGDPTINDHFGDALWRTGRHIDARFQWDHALTFGATGGEKDTIEQKLKTGMDSAKPG
jgi:tetratricopeptide (TPR) repeat protein